MSEVKVLFATTRSKVIDLALKTQFKDTNLLYPDLTRLYEITMDENEGFDGEPMEPELMVKFMFARYQAVGLIPSRN